MIENNRAAGSKQRLELKQAKRDLADFETLKARLIELESSIKNRSELADLRSKLEAEVERYRRMARSEKIRADERHAAMMRAREELEESRGESDARIARLEAAFETLRVEFCQRLGEAPETTHVHEDE